MRTAGIHVGLATDLGELDAAHAVWVASNAARGRMASPERLARVQQKLSDAESCGVVARDDEVVIAMAQAEARRADNGAGAPLPGWGHISMVFVRLSAPRENGRVRIWDVPPRQLCRQHLLGEHRELHGLWNILVVHGGTGGYSRHPETQRWVGKTRALFERHEQLVAEMDRRGYRHLSPLDRGAASGARVQEAFIDSLEDQARLLLEKPCECPLPAA